MSVLLMSSHHLDVDVSVILSSQNTCSKKKSLDYIEVIINDSCDLWGTYHIPGTVSVLCIYYLKSLQLCELDISLILPSLSL